MAQTAGPNDQLPDEIGRLASDTTEMGMAVGDMFRSACAGLFMQEPDSARFAMESASWVTHARWLLDQRTRFIIQRYFPVGDDMRRIAELRYAINALSRIADLSNHIADGSLKLQGQGDALLLRCSPDAPNLLTSFIALVYEQMRGVFLVTAGRDLEQARAVVERDAGVRAYCDALLLRLRYAIEQQPFEAFPLQRLVLVVTNMRDINAAAVAISRAVLPAEPPPTEPAY